MGPEILRTGKGEPDLEDLLPGGRLRPKPAWEPPPFPLLPPALYHLTVRVLEQLGNPYLRYARDPEELRLSPVLYRHRPDLPPEVLRRVHFGVLLAREVAKAEIAGLAAPGDAESERRRLLARLEAHVAICMEGAE